MSKMKETKRKLRLGYHKYFEDFKDHLHKNYNFNNDKVPPTNQGNGKTTEIPTDNAGFYEKAK